MVIVLHNPIASSMYLILQYCWSLDPGRDLVLIYSVTKACFVAIYIVAMFGYDCFKNVVARVLKTYCGLQPEVGHSTILKAVHEH